MHVIEYRNPCKTSDLDLSAYIVLKDGGGNVIGDQLGQINDKDPFSMSSKLPYLVVVTGEHVNDYVQFAYSSLRWTSKDTDQTKQAWCNAGGWDPPDGGSCTGDSPPAVSFQSLHS